MSFVMRFGLANYLTIAALVDMQSPSSFSMSQYPLQCAYMTYNPEPSPLIVLSLSLPYYFSPSPRSSSSSPLRPTVSLSFITNSHSLCSDEERTKGERGRRRRRLCMHVQGWWDDGRILLLCRPYSLHNLIQWTQDQWSKSNPRLLLSFVLQVQ